VISRVSAPIVAIRQHPQGRIAPFDDTGPIVQFRLPDNTRRRIPGTVVKILKPVPRRRVGDQDRSRNYQRTDHMNCYVRDGDSEVEVGHSRCVESKYGIDEASEMKYLCMGGII